MIQKNWENGIHVFLVVFVFIPYLNCYIDDDGNKRGLRLICNQVVLAMVLEYLRKILECPISILKKDFEVHGIVKSTNDSWGRFCCHSLKDVHI